MTEFFMDSVVPFLLTAVTILLGQMFRSANKSLEASNEYKWLNILVVEANVIVMDIWENVVKGTKAAASDGKITKQELNDILMSAKDRAIDHLKSRLTFAPKSIQKIFSDRLSAIVESAVAALKLRLEHLKSKAFGGVSPFDVAKDVEGTHDGN